MAVWCAGEAVPGQQVPPGRERLPLEEHRQLAIKMRMDEYLAPHPTVTVRGWQELHSLAVVRNGVVQGDRTLFLQAEAVVERERSREALPSEARVGGRDSKASVETWEILLHQYIGLVQGRGSGQAQFTHQAILKCPPEPFNAPFGLW